MSNQNIRTSRRVSGRQLDLLWEFLNSHRDIATAYNRSLQAKEYSKKKWAYIAAILNAQAGGAFRRPNEWSKYWVDWKAKLKKKVSALRLAQSATGGGPSTEQPLTDIEQKFLIILGEDFGQGIQGVRVEPFPQTSNTVQLDSVPEVLNSIPQELEVPEEVLLIEMAPLETDEEMLLPSNNNPVSPQLSHAAPAPVALQHSPRRRRRRREPLMTQESARRALVESARLRVEASSRSSNALEGILENLQRSSNSIQAIEKILERIERSMQGGGVSPRAPE